MNDNDEINTVSMLAPDAEIMHDEGQQRDDMVVMIPGHHQPYTIEHVVGLNIGHKPDHEGYGDGRVIGIMTFDDKGKGMMVLLTPKEALHIATTISQLADDEYRETMSAGARPLDDVTVQ